MSKIGLVEQIKWKYQQEKFNTGCYTKIIRNHHYCFVGIYNPEEGHVYTVSDDYDDEAYEDLLSTCKIGDYVEYVDDSKKLKKILKNLSHEKRINEFKQTYYKKYNTR